MAEIIGAAQKADLVIYQGSNLSFDVEWWADEAFTIAINMSARTALIELGGVTYDLGELGYAPFEANICSIALPSALTSTLPAVEGTWSFEATDLASGEEKMLVRGSVKVREES